MKRLALMFLAMLLCIAPLAAAEEAKGEAAEPGIVWQWANFAILAGILGYIGVKQGGPFFNSRGSEIRKGIADAEKIKADSNAKIAAINSKLGRLDSEIASLRESAAAERLAAGQRIAEESQRDIRRLHAHAESEIESAGKSERVALKSYAAKLALELAETKVRARMNPNAEDALVQAFVLGLGVTPARSRTDS